MQFDAKSYPLHYAARCGDISKVRHLIKGGAKVDEPDKTGETPLHHAALRGNLDVVKFLLENGATINKTENKGATPLHRAAVQGKLETVKFLLLKGAELNKSNDNGNTALHLAAWGGHFEVVKYLISQGAEFNKPNTLGENALHLSAQDENLEIIPHLLAKNADLNASTKEGNTVLHIAVAGGYVKVARFLLRAGADVKRKNLEGKTALHQAAENGDVDITNILLEHRANVKADTHEGDTPLHLAAEKGFAKLVQRLVEGGAEISKGNHDGATPLHLAAQEGQLGVAKYLLGKGSKVNVSSPDGRTPLYLASGKGHLELTNFLLEQGADANSHTQNGETSLHFAAQEGKLGVIKSLIGKDGAIIEQSTSDGKTALHLAARSGHIEVVRYLCQQGIGVNKCDKKGEAALHAAVKESHFAVIRFLTGHGANLNKINADGQTVLHIACDKGIREVVDHLLSQTPSKQHRVDHATSLHTQILQVNRTDKNGFTAIHLATRHGHLSIIKILLSHGADLNIPCNNGQTCLHEATKRCRYSERDKQTADEPDKSSADISHNTLTPEKALVFYLLNHGARPDLKDKEGNMPIHYINDVVMKQMFISRSPRMKLEASPEVKSSNSWVGSAGKEIVLEDHGITMMIPKGAVQQNDQCEITLTLLKDPPSPDIQKDESVACYGVRCDPPNMIFHQPVKIKIPHSTLFINPEQVTPDIVFSVGNTSTSQGELTRMTSSNSQDKPPYCKINKEKHLDLFVDRCGNWWVLIPLEQQVIRHQLIFTPYIPDRIERGKEFDVHLHVRTAIPGIETEIEEEERQQGYHKAFRSVPFSLLSNSGDVTVTCDRGGNNMENKKVDLKDIRARMRKNTTLSVSPSENNAPYEVITITVTQAGKLGMFRSFAFVVKYADEVARPIPETSAVTEEQEEASYTDLSDREVLEIAEDINLDQYYDLGVALGFTLTQLDNIEYRRFKDRQQATYDMLIKWRKNLPPDKHAKKCLRDAMKSADMANEEIPDLDSINENQDKVLLAIARRIKSEKYFEIGRNLGFERNELEHIEHRALSNRKDANIQMLGKWMKSQPSSPQAIQTLKLVWRSVQSSDACGEDEDQDFGSMTREQGQPEKDIDQLGGAPTYEEICSVVASVSDMSLARDFGRSLGLDDEILVRLFDPLDQVNLNRMACQLFEGRISRKIVSIKDLLLLCKQKISLHKVSEILFETVKLSPESLHQVIIEFLQEWIQRGGTRDKLLAIVQGFDCFLDAAEKIATEMKNHPGFVDFFSFKKIDHKGGTLELDELGVKLSVPHGALSDGKRYLMTLRVSCKGAAEIPLKKGEVLISPLVECSPIKGPLFKPASVFLPHCIDKGRCGTTRPEVFVYTRKGSGESYDRTEACTQPKQDIRLTKDGIEFQSRHLQLLAVSSNNLRAVRFRCVVFQPLFMPKSHKALLHLHFHNPYSKHAKELERNENNAEVAYCQVEQAVEYSLESTSEDLTIWCLNDGGAKTNRTVPIRDLQTACVSVKFELHFLPREKGKRDIAFLINQGNSVLGTQSLTTSIEAESASMEGGGVSDKMIKNLASALQKDTRKRSLGYKLGFSYFIVNKYLEDESSVSDASASGCQRMLQDWRKRVRPAHQVGKLRESLKKAQLEHLLEILPEGDTGMSVKERKALYERL